VQIAGEYLTAFSKKKKTICDFVWNKIVITIEFYYLRIKISEKIAKLLDVDVKYLVNSTE